MACHTWCYTRRAHIRSPNPNTTARAPPSQTFGPRVWQTAIPHPSQCVPPHPLLRRRWPWRSNPRGSWFTTRPAASRCVLLQMTVPPSTSVFFVVVETAFGNGLAVAHTDAEPKAIPPCRVLIIKRTWVPLRPPLPFVRTQGVRPAVRQRGRHGQAQGLPRRGAQRLEVPVRLRVTASSPVCCVLGLRFCSRARACSAGQKVGLTLPRHFLRGAQP